MLRPAKLRKFYLAVPMEFEEAVSKYIASLKSVELIGHALETSTREEVNTAMRYERILDRAKVLVDSVSSLIGDEEEVKKSFGERLREAFTLKEDVETVVLNKDEVSRVVQELEEKLTNYTAEVDRISRRFTFLKDIKVYVQLFAKYNIPVDIMGDFTHIFIRAGLLPVQNLPLLKDYLKPYNVVINVFEGIRKDYFIILAGSIEDRDEILNYLSVLNFEEIRFPEEFKGDASEVLKQIDKELEEISKEARELHKELKKFNKEVEKYRQFFRFYKEVYSSLVFTKNLAIFKGWVLDEKYDELVKGVREIVGEKFYVEYEYPHEEDHPPTYLKNPGPLKRFELLTRKRGAPNYFEFDPTPIFTGLFLLMYGMMFGDVGGGIILMSLGVILYKLKKPLLGLSYRAINNLGFMLMSAGTMAIIFGFLYGESFLLSMTPMWIKPIKSTIEISIIAIIFGLIQLVIGLILNIIVDLKNGEYFEAVLSWKGLVGLIYYLVGIYLAINFITGGMSLAVFVREDLFPLTMLEIFLLVLVYLKPTIENIMHKEGKPLPITLVEGLQEFIEMFITYLTNSVSYIRLGAFAIAHGALGEAALVFTGLVGFLPSYILFNTIAIVIEGFAAGIQSIRLLYYEFSTKFYRNEGRLFRPLRL